MTSNERAMQAIMVFEREIDAYNLACEFGDPRARQNAHRRLSKLYREALIPDGCVVVSADGLRRALSIIERHTGEEPSLLTDELRAALEKVRR